MIVIAIILCTFASWTAVTLLSRARVNGGRVRNLWVLAASIVFGCGVWATHFVAMLAFRSPFPIGFDITWTGLSVVAAITISTGGYSLVFRPRWALIGGAIIGLAISATHYLGMFAMEGRFLLRFDARDVTASIFLGGVFGCLAVLGGTRIRNVWGRVVAAAALTTGVCAMHFTAMSSVTFVADPSAPFDPGVFAPGMLAISVTAVAILIVALGLVSAHLDRHLELRRTGEEGRLRAYIADLESTKRDLYRALSEASAASRAKSAFLAAMSHELRTPLNAVIGFSELLSAETLGPLGHDRYRSYAGDIHSSGTHLLAVINDILDLSRIDAGKAALDDSPVVVADVLQAAMTMVSPQAARAKLRLIADLPSTLPPLRADERRLRQIFLNLLSNAVKFTPEGGSVIVSAREADGGLIIEFTDTGIGIAAEDMARALDRFGQVDSKLSRKYEGTGLGLPLAKHLTELHGGTLTLRSQVGLGTSVTLSFPATRVARGAAAAA